MPHETYDVVVIGGGPAGSSAAITLAQKGHRVCVVERQTFPRYHVGESLLPWCYWTFQRLGVLDQVKEAGFQIKQSVQFVTASGRLSAPFHFKDQPIDGCTHHDASTTWQVERATFDHLLLKRAEDLGVTVHYNTRASGLLSDDTGRVVGINATCEEETVEIHAALTLDASGRDGFARGRLGWRRPEPALQRVALWAYFDDATHDPDNEQGATTVCQLPGDGWVWYIPMSNGRTSVGVVCQASVLFASTKDPEQAFRAQIETNPWLAQRLRTASVSTPVKRTSDYSYRSEFSAKDGLVLVGDAFAFLDPVFSSGVFLALRTGEEAAIHASAALNAGRLPTASDFDAYSEWARGGIEAMRALVFSFYDPQFSMGEMIRARPELRDDVTDLLIGNLFRRYDALMEGLSDHGNVPPPLPYGGTYSLQPEPQ